MPKRRLKHRELLKKLRKYGVIEDSSRGKGSEHLLIIDRGTGGKYKGPQTSIKYHGDNTEHSPKITESILRTFGINEDEFWKD